MLLSNRMFKCIACTNILYPFAGIFFFISKISLEMKKVDSSQGLHPRLQPHYTEFSVPLQTTQLPSSPLWKMAGSITRFIPGNPSKDTTQLFSYRTTNKHIDQVMLNLYT